MEPSQLPGDKPVFACPTYFGRRFDGHLLPVDVLPDLAAYRDLIVEVAKHIYLESAPGRLRVPKGFADSLQLGLASVQQGSAGAVIKQLAFAGALLVGIDSSDPFVRARDLVADVIDAAGSNRALPPEFPVALLPRFNRIGRSLAPGETMEFRSTPTAKGPTYTRELRKKLVLSAAEQYEDVVTITGLINGAVVDRGQVTVRTSDGLLDFPVGEDVARRSALWIDRNVRLDALVLKGRDDAVIKVVEVSDLTFVEFEASTPLPKQFADLQNLGDGWLDGEGNALAAEGLAKFRDTLVDAVDKYSLPVPYLYPTPDGNARAEWSFPGWEVSAEANLSDFAMSLNAIDLVGDDVAFATIHFGNDSAATRLARWVASYAPQESIS